MKSIIFIKTQCYNETLAGPQLKDILDASVFLDSRWCCSSNPEMDDDIALSLIVDSMIYLINNFIITNRFEHIIISSPYQKELIEEIVLRINCEDYNIFMFDLSNTDELKDVVNFELLNKEFQSEYIKVTDKKLIKYSQVDTTNISAFKIAKTLESIIYK